MTAYYTITELRQKSLHSCALYVVEIQELANMLDMFNAIGLQKLMKVGYGTYITPGCSF
jgi:hypothetical protein